MPTSSLEIWQYNQDQLRLAQIDTIGFGYDVHDVNAADFDHDGDKDIIDYHSRYPDNRNPFNDTSTVPRSWPMTAGGSGRSRTKMAMSIRVSMYGPFGNDRAWPGTNVNPRQAVARRRVQTTTGFRAERLAPWGLDAA